MTRYSNPKDIFKFTVVREDSNVYVEQARIESSGKEKYICSYHIGKGKIKSGKIYKTFLDFLLDKRNKFKHKDFYDCCNQNKISITKQVTGIIYELGFKGEIKKAFFIETSPTVDFRKEVTY